MNDSDDGLHKDAFVVLRSAAVAAESPRPLRVTFSIIFGKHTTRISISETWRGDRFTGL